MEKHKAWTDLFCEHRDAAIAAAAGHIPSVRHRIQHAWRDAWWSSISGSKESTRKAVKIENNMIYWGKRVCPDSRATGDRGSCCSITTHLYAVSSRQQSNDWLRCNLGGEYAGI